MDLSDSKFLAFSEIEFLRTKIIIKKGKRKSLPKLEKQSGTYPYLYLKKYPGKEYLTQPAEILRKF